MTGISLKAARVNADVSPTEAAEYAGVSTKTIYNWEQNLSRIDAVSLRRLCGLYSVNSDDIILSE